MKNQKTTINVPIIPQRLNPFNHFLKLLMEIKDDIEKIKEIKYKMKKVFSKKESKKIYRGILIMAIKKSNINIFDAKNEAQKRGIDSPYESSDFNDINFDNLTTKELKLLYKLILKFEQNEKG